MKRTQIFTFIMAIVWTIIGVFVILYATRGGKKEKSLLLIMLALSAIGLNWIRWMRTR